MIGLTTPTLRPLCSSDGPGQDPESPAIATNHKAARRSMARAAALAGQSLMVSAALAVATLPGHALAANGQDGANEDVTVETEADTQTDVQVDVEDESDAALYLAPLPRPHYGMTMYEGPAAAPAPAPVVVAPPTGVGLIVGGSIIIALPGLILTGLGASSMVAFSACKDTETIVNSSGDEVLSAACKTTRNVGLGLLISGLLSLGGGATMIAFGAKRHIAYKQWKAENGIVLTPTFGRTANNTGVYGMAMRF